MGRRVSLAHGLWVDSTMMWKAGQLLWLLAVLSETEAAWWTSGKNKEQREMTNDNLIPFSFSSHYWVQDPSLCGNAIYNEVSLPTPSLSKIHQKWVSLMSQMFEVLILILKGFSQSKEKLEYKINWF